MAGFSVLASAAAILTGLRRLSVFTTESTNPTWSAVGPAFEVKVGLRRMPRRLIKSWGRSIHVILDRHRRLATYWNDQDYVVRALRRVYPRDGFQVSVLAEGSGELRLCEPRREVGHRLPQSGTTVLVLGDLGCLDADRSKARDDWVRWGQYYREHGSHPLALVPCNAANIPKSLSLSWTIIPWECLTEVKHKPLSQAESEKAIDDILVLLSFALRVEPSLIREVRRMLDAGRRDAGIESRVWQSDAIQTRNHEAASFRSEAAEQLRTRRHEQPPELLRKVIEKVKQFRRGSYPGVWFAETIGAVGYATTAAFDATDTDESDPMVRAAARRARSESYIAHEDPSGDQATWF